MYKKFMRYVVCLVSAVSLLCTQVYAEPEPYYRPLWFADLPNQPMFRPELVSCSMQSNAKTEALIKKFFFDNEEKKIWHQIEKIDLDAIYRPLRTWADNGDATAAKTYTMLLWAKMINDLAARTIYGGMSDKQFDEKFGSMLQLAYTYFYLPVINKTDKEMADLFVGEDGLQFSAQYYYNDGKALFDAAKADAKRWQYLCNHAEERAAAVKKLQQANVEICPPYVDYTRDRWEAWVRLRQRKNLPIYPQDKEKDVEFAEYFGFGANRPLPQVVNCLPQRFEGVFLPDVH